MSKKTMNQQLAEQLADQLDEQTSPFQQEGFRMPVNPTTGKNYRGMTAIQLAMMDKADPRWMTLRQASAAKWKIASGSKGTMISFAKTQDRVTLLDENGDPKLNSKKKPVTQLIKLEKPVLTNAFVFNAEQVEDIPTLAEYLEEKTAAKVTPAERLANLIEASGAQFEYGYPQLGYDQVDDQIFMPSREEMEGIDFAPSFEGAQLYGLALWTAHESRMNRELDSPVAEEMRAAVVSLMLGSEIGVGSYTEPKVSFRDWAQLLRDDPDALERIVTDAQYMTDYIRKLEPAREQKEAQSTRADRSLQVGDVIPYNNSEYEVMSKLKKNALQVQEKESGNRFKVSLGDGIYNSLVQAKLQMAKAPEQKQEAEQGIDHELDEDRSMQEEHEQELENENDFMPELNLEEGESRKGGMKR
jgi:antirestriction protein ArdC